MPEPPTPPRSYPTPPPPKPGESPTVVPPVPGESAQAPASHASEPANVEHAPVLADHGPVPKMQEFGGKRRLPPLAPILIALAAVAIVVAVVSFTTRAKPAAGGAITKIAAADQQGNTMAAVQVKIDNKIEKKIWIKDVSSELETADGRKYPDHAAPAVDAGRYLEAFPALREAQSNAEPLREELTVAPGASYTGFAVFSFPVNKEVFDARKSLTVRIELYDQAPLVIKQ